MLAAIPLPVLPVALYAVLVIALGGDLHMPDAHARLTRPLFRMPMSAGDWPVSASDLLLAFALVSAFLEMIKDLADRRIAVANQALCGVLFVACLAGMLAAPAFATSTFFLITLMVLLDLTASLMAARARSPADQD